VRPKVSPILTTWTSARAAPTEMNDVRAMTAMTDGILGMILIFGI
jgi:hypothetical protein